MFRIRILLTLAGLLAALGPQAINFGISVGGGETMLIPNIASLGGTRLFWLMTISTVLETVVVYECIKYSMVTGRYTGRVTGVLRPPEEINAAVLPWDTSNPEEVRKMQGWVSVGKWSLILWWSVIGAMFMTFLYATAGQAYLFKRGIVASGLDVPLQMATIVGGVFGPLAFAIFLVFLFVTLYDAEFAIYDTFIGRTVTDAIASTPRLRGRHPYRVYYFIVVTVAIAAGFYLVTLGQPYALWLLVAFLAIIMRSIAAAQILYVNKRHLPAAFKPSVFNQVVLWFTIISGFLCASIWGYAYFAGI